ncbi:SDR family NAD(P)-dependent oxidoreductase [Echinicola sediminis]
MSNKIDLKGKKALITGGNSGIGKDICRKMAACGADIIINFLHNEEAAELLAKDLEYQYGIKAVPMLGDITSEEAIKGMFAKVDEEFGGIDILVNNAGYESVDHAVDMSLEEWDKVFNVNLRGAFICAQEAGKRMIMRQGGVIINISSIHDKVPRKGLVHYCASKAALNMMTKCLALELAENNIRVVAVSPGAIETEMNKEEINAFGRDKFEKWIPAGKVGKVDDVSWACAFLASDMADYCTGTELYIDGAYKESTIPYDPRPKKDN